MSHDPSRLLLGGLAGMTMLAIVSMNTPATEANAVTALPMTTATGFDETVIQRVSFRGSSLADPVSDWQEPAGFTRTFEYDAKYGAYDCHQRARTDLQNGQRVRNEAMFCFDGAGNAVEQRGTRLTLVSD